MKEIEITTKLGNELTVDEIQTAEGGRNIFALPLRAGLHIAGQNHVQGQVVDTLVNQFVVLNLHIRHPFLKNPYFAIAAPTK